MRFAISGSTGFIGRALSAELRRTGHEVLPIVRGNPRRGELTLDITRGQLDLSSSGLEDLSDLDAIFHLAGESLTFSRWNAEKRESIRSSRIRTTGVLARSIAESNAKPKALVSMSAVGYYGNRGDEMLTEASGHGYGFLADLCQAWEHASKPAEEAGVRIAHARTGIVLGSGGGIMKRLAPLFRAGFGGVIGSGKQWMSPIGLEDEVRALIFLATHSTISGPVNLTGPAPITNLEFTRALGRHVHRPTPFKVPPIALRVAVGTRATEEMALASQRVLPKKLTDDGFEFRAPTLETMLSNVR